MILFVATGNSHKLREISEIFTSVGLACDLQSPLSKKLNSPEPEENGLSFEENALIKAEFYHQLTNLPCIADDSGLEIDYLNGAPGINSARFSGLHGNDAANRRKVLELLSGLPEEKRKARFRAVICLKTADSVHYFEGICEGRIANEERGAAGFGYDPVFIPESFDISFAEMSSEQKNKLSHRGKAVRKLAEHLKSICL